MSCYYNKHSIKRGNENTYGTFFFKNKKHFFFSRKTFIAIKKTQLVYCLKAKFNALLPTTWINCSSGLSPFCAVNIGTLRPIEIKGLFVPCTYTIFLNNEWLKKVV